MGCAGRIRSLAAMLSILGLVVPTPHLQAAEGLPSSAGSAARDSLAVMDVKLAADGTLSGQVVTPLGDPLASIPVVVLRRSSLEAQVVTDRRGDFVVRGLHGGTHQVLAAGTGRVVRLWVSGTAPPSAAPGLLVVAERTTVLAQREPGPLGRGYERIKCCLADPLVVATVVAAAVAIPVAVFNARQDRDREPGS